MFTIIFLIDFCFFIYLIYKNNKVNNYVKIKHISIAGCVVSFVLATISNLIAPGNISSLFYGLFIVGLLIYIPIERKHGKKKNVQIRNLNAQRLINNFKHNFATNYSVMLVSGNLNLNYSSCQELGLHPYDSDINKFAIYKFSDDSISFEPSENHNHYFLLNVDFHAQHSTITSGGGSTPTRVKLNKDLLDDDYSGTVTGGVNPTRTSTYEAPSNAILTLLPVHSHDTFNIQLTNATTNYIAYIKQDFLLSDYQKRRFGLK